MQATRSWQSLQDDFRELIDDIAGIVEAEFTAGECIRCIFDGCDVGIGAERSVVDTVYVNAQMARYRICVVPWRTAIVRHQKIKATQIEAKPIGVGLKSKFTRYNLANGYLNRICKRCA